MSPNKIIVIGSANTDMVVKATKLPLPGETVLGGTFYMNAGGKGANQAVAAARLGGNVSLVTKVGNDIFGKQTVEGLRKDGIKTDYVFTDNKSPSGTALIILNEEGENCIVVAPGANANLLPSDIEKVKQVSRAKIILMQLEIPMETIAFVVKNAKKTHQKVIINPAPAQKLDDELLKGLFLITPNETEAALLTGITVIDEETASQASKIFLDKGVENVIITLGKEGAYFENNNQHFKIPAPLVKVIDTTAAGDTFSGAIAVALTEKQDRSTIEWEQVVKFAIVAASKSVTRLGAQVSIPYKKEIVLY
ncbi:ribokinase [Arenibacter latericius]|uniref:ribokinase n=1 Tax=Arenibacter latericius TaxID=86104 RepID=UPI0003FFA90D|nr:ribokinase [Arenibacter latericius]